MIAAVVVGWLLQLLAGIDGALLPALLIGVVVASFVPAKGACGLRLPRSSSPEGPDSR